MLYHKWSIVHFTTRTVYASVVLSLLHSRSPCHSLMCTPCGSRHAEKSIYHTCVHQTSVYVSHFLVRIVSFTAAPPQLCSMSADPSATVIGFRVLNHCRCFSYRAWFPQVSFPPFPVSAYPSTSVLGFPILCHRSWFPQAHLLLLLVSKSFYCLSTFP